MVFVALVASGIVISISTCLNVWDWATQAAETNQEARAILDLLSRDIQSSYPGLDQRAGYVLSQGAASGGAPINMLELSTQSSGVSRIALLPEEELPAWDDPGRPPVTDYVIVSYEGQKAGGDEPAELYRSVSVVPTARTQLELEAGEPTAYQVSSELISSSVVELRYQFYDGLEQEWVGGWDTAAEPDRPLLAVSVKLVLRDARKRDHVYKTIVPTVAR
jgi:hypothetical protein